jgi:exopolyphosphatase/guanosine-5'-triphosphate,3'-diphosphate pyrophosphatase
MRSFEMNKIGIIYIGANSVKFTLMNVLDSGYYKIINEASSDIRLAQDLIHNDDICEQKINETLANFRSFKSLCKICELQDIIAVATCTLSKARNYEYFLNLIKKNFDIDVKLLSADDEIKYTYLGVTKSIYTSNSLIVDICGACTHLTAIKDGQIQNSITIPYGSLSHTYTYNLNDRVLYDDLKNAISIIKDTLNNIEWLNIDTYDSIIGVGGTARSVCKVDRAKKRYPFNALHNYRLNSQDVHQIYNSLKCNDYNQRVNVQGLSPESADLIVGGLTIFDTIIQTVNCEDIIISGRGLREGFLFSYIEDNYGPIKDILDYNLNGIIDYLHINKSHANRVFNMTYKIFDELQSLHRLGTSYDNALKTATLLNNSGISIDYYHHNVHSFYVILHSNINGLSHKELIVSAAIAATHNNKNTVPLQPFFSIISKLDIMAIEAIGLLLSIAESLDRSLENPIDSLNIDITDSFVLITLSSDLNISFEINQALKVKKKFKEIYHRELKIEQI